MNERRRLLASKKKELVLYTKRFYPAGKYTWVVPEGCTSVDVFLVGGGGGGSNSGGGGGYTKTFKSSTSGWRDGGAVSVTPGESISIIVGAGGPAITDGGYSQFKSSSYRANGGHHWYASNGSSIVEGGDGGSGGGSYNYGGSDGENGDSQYDNPNTIGGLGQGHTTSDFGEGINRNAGGGAGQNGSSWMYTGGSSDYSEGSGAKGRNSVGNGASGGGGGGYGGGGGAGRGTHVNGGTGGDGTVLIRYYAYKQ